MSALEPSDPLRVHAEALACLARLLGPSDREGRRRAAALLAGRGLLELARRGVGEWAAEDGIGPREAVRLAAAFALGRVVEQARHPQRPSMRSPRRVFEATLPRLRGLEREVFLTLVLDGRHRLRRIVRVSEGTLTTSLVHPREVFRPAIRESAAAVVVVHNHPSGDPEPSGEDLETTRRLAAAGRLLGIALLDHVIVGDGCYVSLRERIDFDACRAPRAERSPA